MTSWHIQYGPGCRFHCRSRIHLPLNRAADRPFFTIQDANPNVLWCTLQLIQLTVLCATRSLTSCISLDSIFFRFRLPELINACRERITAASYELLNSSWRARVQTPMFTHCAGQFRLYRPTMSWNHSLAAFFRFVDS
jgi:hypothetical protein